MTTPIEQPMSREERKMARIIASIEKMEQRTSGTNKKRKHGAPENPVQEGEKNAALNRSKESIEKQAHKKKKTDSAKVNKKDVDEKNKKEKSETRARPRRRLPMRKRKGIKLPPKKYWLKQYKSDLARSITISMPKPKQVSLLCEPEPVHELHGDSVSSSPRDGSGSNDIVRQLLNDCIKKIEDDGKSSLKKQFRPVLKSLEILGSTGDSFMSPQPSTGLWQQHTQVVNPEHRDGSENSSKVAIVEQHTTLRARNLSDSPTADDVVNVKSFDSSSPAPATQPLSLPPQQ